MEIRRGEGNQRDWKKVRKVGEGSGSTRVEVREGEVSGGRGRRRRAKSERGKVEAGEVN